MLVLASLLSTIAAVAQDRLTVTTASRLVQWVRGGVFGHVLATPGRVLEAAIRPVMEACRLYRVGEGGDRRSAAGSRQDDNAR